MKRRRIKLPRWQKYGLLGCVILLTLTGGLWLLLHHFVQTVGAFGPQSHPLEHPALVLHGIAGAAGLVFFGSVLSLHVPLGWRSGRQRITGALMLGLWASLALTALGLYYLSDDSWRSLTSLLHWIMGLLMSALFIWHGFRRGSVPD